MSIFERVPLSPLVLALAVVLASCSSTPVSHIRALETTSQIPGEYSAESSTNSLKVVVIHDDLAGPNIFTPNIHVQGVRIGSVRQEEKITFYTAPGVLRLGWSVMTDGNYREQEFIVSNSSHNVFHLVSPGGDVLRFIRESAIQTK